MHNWIFIFEIYIKRRFFFFFSPHLLTLHLMSIRYLIIFRMYFVFSRPPSFSLAFSLSIYRFHHHFADFDEWQIMFMDLEKGFFSDSLHFNKIFLSVYVPRLFGYWYVARLANANKNAMKKKGRKINWIKWKKCRRSVRSTDSEKYRHISGTNKNV